MSTEQVTSINIITRDAEEIIRSYPTMVDHYEDCGFDGFDSWGPKTYIYNLYIVYLEQGKQKVDIYYREEDCGTDGDPYELFETQTLADALSGLTPYNQPYKVLSRVLVNGFVNRKRLRFQDWLWRAREKIVAREAHPDKIIELAEFYGLDNIEDAIEAKLALMLSW